MSDLKMPDINNILIAGQVVTEPSLANAADGTQVVSFCISANRKYRDNSGIVRENICLVGVSAVDKLAESCMNNITKDKKLLVEGELSSKSIHVDDETTKNVIEIRARRIQFFESPQITSTQIEEAEEKSEPLDIKTVDIEPTEYDFGYQNLKL